MCIYICIYAALRSSQLFLGAPPFHCDARGPKTLQTPDHPVYTILPIMILILLISLMGTSRETSGSCFTTGRGILRGWRDTVEIVLLEISNSMKP